jgi:hypothetical protein
MFRQVISYRWKDGVTEQQKAAFAAAFAGLREIPELISNRFADDARHFDGNYDVVAVMDFPDFASARRYVADDRHQAYIRDFASQMIGERVVVQHDWAVGDLVGVQRVSVPVSDLVRSEHWYAAAFGFVPHATGENGENDVPSRAGAGDAAMVMVMRHPEQPIEVALVLDPVRAAALAGFPLVTFSVGTQADLATLTTRLTSEGIAHGPASGSPLHVDVPNLDGIVVRLATLL